VSSRSRQALALIRVESMATLPSLPMPSLRAISSTCVKQSFRAFAWRRRNALRAQLSTRAPAAR
jgi:hypothetical protein